MKCLALPLQGALLITPRVFTDERGFFKETFSAERYREAGVAEVFVQDNVSRSRRDTLRGLHGDPRMAKLVQVLAGEAFDAIVDVRPGSSTYGRWHAERLTADNHAQMYVPRGFLHGFLALTDDTVLSYKQSALYDPSSEFGVVWNDPQIGIAWPLDGRTPLLSPKDAALPQLRNLLGAQR